MLTTGAAEGGARAKIALSRHCVWGLCGVANSAAHVSTGGRAASTVAGTPADCLPIAQMEQGWDARSMDGG
jgi:hypothetical protein